MEGINDTENGGEMEEGGNLRTQNKQTKCIENVKDSKIDWQAILTYMESKFDDIMTRVENSIKEDLREMLAALTRDS